MYCHNCMKKIREGTLCTSCMIESNYESMVHHLKSGTKLNKKYFVGNVIGEGGFRPCSTEWWDFTLIDEPYPKTYFSFPVGTDSISGNE